MHTNYYHVKELSGHAHLKLQCIIAVLCYAEESRDIGQIILTCQFSKARQQGVEAYKVHCMNYTPHPHPNDKKIYNGTVDLLTLVKTLNK